MTEPTAPSETAIQSAANGEHDPWRQPPAAFDTLSKGLQGDDDAATAADGI